MSSRKGRLHEEKQADPSCRPGNGDDALEYFGEAAVDIIAVHGLASTYDRTWSVTLDNSERYHWLRAKLGVDVPQARILGHEYGSEWYGDPSYTNLEECGAELLRCIIRDRRHAGRHEMCPTRRRRPIVFIAHSFGGLVVKQAMVEAYRVWKAGDDAGSATSSGITEATRRGDAANCRDFLCSVAGVVFLGTPHRGSAFSGWARVKMAVGSLMGQQSHPGLVKVLAANSEPLRELQRAFDEVCNDPSVLDIIPRCYRETRDVKLPPYIVVTAESAFLDGAVNGSMDANHMEMNKFYPGRDANYDKVLSDIHQILSQAARSVSRRLEKWRYGSLIAEDDRKMVEHTLDPSSAPQRRHLQAKFGSHQAAPYTCHWLDEQPFFLDWKARQSRNNVLWIHGKPASGKSVLAAYAIHALGIAEHEGGLTYLKCQLPLGERLCDSKVVKPTILYFFCGIDRSHDTPEGLCGTLIHQLLLAHDTDEAMFATAHRWKEATPASRITRTSLFGLFHALIQHVAGPIFIVVDGLDESPHGPECLQPLTTTATIASPGVRLLVLSQRQETLRELLERRQTLTKISITDFTRPDIQQYAKHKTDQLVARRPIFTEKHEIIAEKLQSEADGVFELINANLDHLERHVVDPEDVDDYLVDLPNNLQGVYEKIFARMDSVSQETKTRAQAALKLLVVSATPISVPDLHTALKITRLLPRNTGAGVIGDLCGSRWSSARVAAAARDLVLLLGSLIEIDGSGFVTLVHPSLRRTILMDHASPTPTSHTAWYQFSAAHAHRLASEICIAICTDTTLMQASAPGTQPPPLLSYAWNYWAYHVRGSGPSLAASTLEGRDRGLAMDRMLRQVHRDTLSFLGALSDFVTTPLEPVEGRYTLLEYRQSLQRAQGAIPPAIDALCKSRQTIPVVAKLKEARSCVPLDLSDVSPETAYHQACKWATRRASRARNWMLRDETQVARVKIDDLVETTAIGVVAGEDAFKESALLLGAARALRLLALSFSVNPIYTVLNQRGGRASFSPINLLVHVAQLLEEAGSFPYWDHLPEMLDPAEAFLCNDSDPQAGPARFVLRLVHWQRPNARLAAELESSNDAALTASLDTTLGKQLQELSEVTAHRWIAARYAFDTFRRDGDETNWFHALVANPLSNLHIRDTLFMLSDTAARPYPWPVFLSPATTLDLHAPITLAHSPAKQLLTALPALLKLTYAKYLATLLEFFAGVPRADLVGHFILLSLSRAELAGVRAYFVGHLRRLPARRLVRLVPAVVVLFLLRGWLAPGLGAHAMAHPWGGLLLAYRHPAAYLDLQALHDAKFWFRYMLGMRVWTAVGRSFMGLVTAAAASSPADGEGVEALMFVSDVLAGFYQLVTLERNMFGLGFSLAVLTAAARVILYDGENLGRVVEFTAWFIVWNGLGIMNMFAGAVLQQTRATFLQGLAVVGVEVAVVVVLVVYQAAAARVLLWVLSWVFWPITGPVMLLWRLGLYVYAPFLKICGVAVFVGLVLLAVVWLDKMIWDPHDLEASRNAVLKAKKKIEGLRDNVRKLKIGDGPLGGGAGLLAPQGGDEADSWDWPEHEGTEEDEEANESDGEDAIGNPHAQAASGPSSGSPSGQEIVPDLNAGLQILSTTAATEFATAFGPLIRTVQGMDFNNPGGAVGNSRSVHYSTYSSSGSGHFSTYSSSGSGHFSTYSSSGSGLVHGRSLGGAGGLFGERFGTHRQHTVLRNDEYDADLYRERRGNGWHFGGAGPGDPFGTLSYTYTSTSSGPEPWWSERMFFVVPAVMVGIWGWALWLWWTGKAEFVPVERCWQIGVPIGPVTVGYGCKGWFWEVTGMGY